MILNFEDMNIYFRLFVIGVQCNLLGQDLITKFQRQWNYDENSLSLNFEKYKIKYLHLQMFLNT